MIFVCPVVPVVVFLTPWMTLLAFYAPAKEKEVERERERERERKYTVQIYSQLVPALCVEGWMNKHQCRN